MTIAETGHKSKSESASDPASFWEIFKHAWPLLFERPLPLVMLAGVLAAATQLIGLGVDALQGPYQPLFDAFMESQTTAPSAEANRVLVDGVAAIGWGRLIASWLLPYAWFPWTWLAMCQAALFLWDGWRVGPGSLLFATVRYLSGLKAMAIISFFAVFLFLFSLMALVPLLLIRGLSGQGAPAGALILNVLGLAAGLFFFVKILWPHIRRFLLLQFLVYLEMADGGKGPFASGIWRLYERLKSYPSHMGQGVGVFILSFVGISVIVGIVLNMALMAGVPRFAADLLSGMIFFLGLAWPLTALAGFHRLILSPQGPDGPPPAP